MAIIYKRTWDGTVHYLSWYEPVTWNGLVDNAFHLPKSHALLLVEKLDKKYKYDKVDLLK